MEHGAEPIMLKSTVAIAEAETKRRDKENEGMGERPLSAIPVPPKEDTHG